MSDQVQAAAVTQPQSLTVAEAAQRYAESKVAPVNPVSEAARTLGQQAAKAREERRAQAAATQESPQGEAQQVQDEPLTEPLDGTATGEPPTTEAKPEDESAPQTIDLGEGVTVTVDEVRDGLMLKADHTRKTMALAEKAKAFEAASSQKLAQLDESIGLLAQKLGQPKTLKQWLAEDPVGGLEKFADQAEQMETINRARAKRNDVEQRHISEALVARDQELSESYNKEWADPDKRDKAYTEISSFGLRHGAKPEHLRQLTEPWMVKVLDMALSYEKSQAGAASVTKVLAAKPTVVKPGAKVSVQSAASTNIQQAQSRLKSSGSIQDAVALLRAQRGVR